MARPKKVSMQMIADDLHISKNAVSLALSGKKGVSDEVRDAVIRRAQELGYGLKGYPSIQNSNILVLIPDRVMGYEDNEHFHFYHDLLWGVEAAVRKKGCNAVIAKIDSEMEQQGVLPGIFDIPHAGVIMFGIMEHDYAQKVWALDAPLVMLDSYYRDLPCAVAASANLEGAYEAVRHLLNMGHTRIGFIGSSNLTTSQEDRWFGYVKALGEQGLFPAEADYLRISAGLQFTREEIAGYLARLEGNLPTAFFCGNDRIALQLYEQLIEMGYRIPQQMSIVGFDDIKLSAAADPALTTMRVDKAGMAKAAVELLLSKAGTGRSRIVAALMPELIVRGSTTSRTKQ